MNPSDTNTSTPWNAWAISLALSMIAAALALVTRADADLWGHLRFGLDLLRDRYLSYYDPYSFTQDKPWVSHEWLSELQMALAYTAGGTTGLLILKASILWIVFALVWRELRGVAAGTRHALMALMAMGTIHITSSLRPQTWTFLCVTVLCVALSQSTWTLRRWLPLVFTFWANCHGGFIVGLGVLGVWAATQVWQTPRAWRAWTLLTAACLAATLVNPFRIGLWVFLATTVRMTRSITEWEPLWVTPVFNWVPWFTAVAGIIWMWRRRPANRLSISAVLLMLSYASARVMRVESLFVTAALILLAPTIAARWPRQPTRLLLSKNAAGVLALLLLVAALGASVALGRWATSCVPIVGPWIPDLAAADVLKHAGPGRLVTSFDWGQYATVASLTSIARLDRWTTRGGVLGRAPCAIRRDRGGEAGGPRDARGVESRVRLVAGHERTHTRVARSTGLSG